MPYIAQKDREELSTGRDVGGVGELNFLISSLLGKWLLDNGLSYTNVNAVIGVLECAKMELYEVIARAYEDLKIQENGDLESYVKLGEIIDDKWRDYWEAEAEQYREVGKYE